MDTKFSAKTFYLTLAYDASTGVFRVDAMEPQLIEKGTILNPEAGTPTLYWFADEANDGSAGTGTLTFTSMPTTVSVSNVTEYDDQQCTYTASMSVPPHTFEVSYAPAKDPQEDVSCTFTLTDGDSMAAAPTITAPSRKVILLPRKKIRPVHDDKLVQPPLADEPRPTTPDPTARFGRR